MAFFQFNNISISGLAVAVPKNVVQVNSYDDIFGKKYVDSFIQNSGIINKHIAKEEQTTSDLGYVAAKTLIEKKKIETEEIRIIIFVSKTPDYRNPPSAAVLQHRLKLDKNCLAYDINIGSAGFIYGLQVGCSLLESMPVKYALLIIGDTTSKQVSEKNPLSMMFGDGSSAILLEKTTTSKSISLYTGSESDGFNSYMQQEGGFRLSSLSNHMEGSISALSELKNDLQINESRLLTFILSEIPIAINFILAKTLTTINDYNIIAFHQEKEDFRRQIAEILGISFEKIVSNLSKYGNTCGASIPLLLVDNYGTEKAGDIRVLSCGYGEGFSMGVASFFIKSSDIFPIIETDDFFTEGAVSRDF